MEPLKELSLFAYHWAPLLCDSADCTSYHKNWSLIRLLDGRGRQPDYPEFFIENIKIYASQPSSKILISGAADTGVLSVVHDAIVQMGVTPQITLIDKCKTTIQQNKLYAEYLNLKVDFIAGDVLLEKLSSYDLILAHSFLNFFNDQSLEILFKQWNSFLKVGGVLLLNNKSVEINSANGARQVDRSLICERIKNVELEALRLNLSTEYVNSIKEFWLNGSIRKLILQSRLIELIKKNNFLIKSHQSRKSESGSGPTSVRYGENCRFENLIVLQK